MTRNKQIPRIQSISEIDGFRVYCVFNTGEHGVINFERLLAEWGVKPSDTEGRLLNLDEFQKVKLRDGVLSWKNVEVSLIKEDGTEGKFPYEIDPIVLYNQRERITNDKDTTSVLELKGDILNKVGLLEDEEQLKRVLLFVTQELGLEENIEEGLGIPHAPQKRHPYIQEEVQSSKKFISEQGLTF